MGNPCHSYAVCQHAKDLKRERHLAAVHRRKSAVVVSDCELYSQGVGGGLGYCGRLHLGPRRYGFLSPVVVERSWREFGFGLVHDCHVVAEWCGCASQLSRCMCIRCRQTRRTGNGWSRCRTIIPGWILSVACSFSKPGFGRLRRPDCCRFLLSCSVAWSMVLFRQTHLI